jgi:MscS family membrane protein
MSLIGVCLALQVLKGHDALYKDVTSVLIVFSVTYAVYQAVELSGWWVRRLRANVRTALDDMMEPVIRKTLRVTIVLLGLLVMVERLSDKPITSILAGLGIGGLAVALAAQDTIKNFFGSLVIFGDHPFHLGDLITVDGIDGTIEEVGMRSTRIRTLDGHLVTFPNGELANKTICNISRRPYIKRTANITATYDTPPEKLQRAIEIIKEELNRKNECFPADFPPRVYFNGFNADSLNILVNYWYAPADYWAFMEFDQAFNLAILRRFNEEGIEFAFPTQTLYLAGDTNRPLNLNR